jgi:hypothetical protein
MKDFENKEARTNTVSHGPCVEDIHSDGYQYSNHPILHYSVRKTNHDP